MARRFYSSIAQRTALSAPVDATTTTLIVDAVVGWPASFPYTLIIDEDTVSEELVQVTGRSATTLTVVRGVDGSTGASHSAGADVRHGVSARDFNEPNLHVNTNNIHWIICTSTTRPVSPEANQVILETDTRRVLSFIGGQWQQVSSDTEGLSPLFLIGA
jgi:hypothetical protein